MCEKLVSLPVRERIGRFKYQDAGGITAEYQAVIEQLHAEISGVVPKEAIS